MSDKLRSQCRSGLRLLENEAEHEQGSSFNIAVTDRSANRVQQHGIRIECAGFQPATRTNHPKYNDANTYPASSNDANSNNNARHPTGTHSIS